LNKPVSNKTMLYGLMLTALFLVALACINFINLTTARASAHAKEIGIRKTMGSSRAQLTFQFLCEIFTITGIASVLSLSLLPLLAKAFADYMPYGFYFSMADPLIALFLALLTILVSLLAGMYPSMVLSSGNAVDVLKNQAQANSGRTRKAWMRQTLTVSQFVIAQFFIMGTFVVAKQIRYMMNTDLGFRKEAVISFFTPRNDTSTLRRQTLLNEIKKLPAVEMASLGSDVANSGGWWTAGIDYNDGKNKISTIAELKAGDDNYLTLFHIPLIAGRTLLPADTIREVVINETYQRKLGFKTAGDAIGKTLTWDDRNIPIVGVMKDFHEQSLHSLMGPMVLGGNNGGFFHIKLKANNADGSLWRNAIAGIQKSFKKIYPEEDFGYKFFDDSIAKFYESEQHTASLLQWATGLAIFISCLGLLGLVIYTTNTRTKEIGIRKILGASVANIISILSKDFVKLVIIAFVIAAPVAWWATYKWLQDFVYRTGISWWVFAGSGVFMLMIALITLSVQTIKTAVANPVKSLRTE